MPLRGLKGTYLMAVASDATMTKQPLDECRARYSAVSLYSECGCIAVEIVEQLEKEGNFPQANYAFDSFALYIALISFDVIAVDNS